jgi:23S rRNA (adenine1618-N6)-methyltransferase
MSTEKSSLHTRNLHRNPYDFDQLISCVPELKHYVFVNAYQTRTINFSIPQAVKLLNKALLQYFYNVKDWDIPDANLCPPIPGRADYVHYIADLLTEQSAEIPNRNFHKRTGYRNRSQSCLSFNCPCILWLEMLEPISMKIL